MSERPTTSPDEDDSSAIEAEPEGGLEDVADLSDTAFDDLLAATLAAAGVGDDAEDEPPSTVAEPAEDDDLADDPRIEELEAEAERLRAERANLERRLEALMDQLGTFQDRCATLEEKLDTRDNQVTAYHQRLTRAAAEIDAMRRRSARERQESRRYGGERVLREFLGTLDDLDRAHQAMSGAGASLESMMEGLQLIRASFERALRRSHVTEIEVGDGTAFDPTWHEAMVQAHHPEIAAQHVMGVLQRGFRLHDRLLRAARVAVSAGPPPAPPAPEPEDVAPEPTANTPGNGAPENGAPESDVPESDVPESDAAETAAAESPAVSAGESPDVESPAAAGEPDTGSDTGTASSDDLAGDSPAQPAAAGPEPGPAEDEDAGEADPEPTAPEATAEAETTGAEVSGDGTQPDTAVDDADEVGTAAPEDKPNT